MIGTNAKRGLMSSVDGTAYSLSCVKPTGLMPEHYLSHCCGMHFTKCFVISEVFGLLHYSVHTAWDGKLSCFHPNVLSVWCG